MLLNKTKKKIIIAAVELFNEFGIAQVRNQDIAKQSGISLSNFNYHFPTKKDLIISTLDYMTDVLVRDVYGNRKLIMEGEGLTITKCYFEYQEQFCFFFLDTPNILKAYPEINEQIQEQINEAFKIIKGINYLSIGMGFMKPEPKDYPGLYDDLSAHIWRNTHFWISYARIKGFDEDLVVKGMQSHFSLSYPYLTDKGVSGYRKYLERLVEERQKPE